MNPFLFISIFFPFPKTALPLLRFGIPSRKKIASIRVVVNSQICVNASRTFGPLKKIEMATAGFEPRTLAVMGWRSRPLDHHGPLQSGFIWPALAQPPCVPPAGRQSRARSQGLGRAVSWPNYNWGTCIESAPPRPSSLLCDFLGAFFYLINNKLMKGLFLEIIKFCKKMLFFRLKLSFVASKSLI